MRQLRLVPIDPALRPKAEPNRATAGYDVWCPWRLIDAETREDVGAVQSIKVEYDVNQWPPIVTVRFVADRERFVIEGQEE